MRRMFAHTELQTAAALLWLVALWYAGPIVAKRVPLGIAERLACTLVLATAIPLLLACVHLLEPVALFVSAAVLCALRRRFVRSSAVAGDAGWDLAAAAVVLVIASPNIVRPPLEGDSLAYHLPNAIAWLQAGSLDPTWMRYWWYPGGSELAVAGLIGSGGLWISGAITLLAAAMLAVRLASWLRTIGVAPLTALALVSAFTALPVFAFQTYDARNDVILAAWFAESLWALHKKSPYALIPLAALALVKPDGWIFALIAIACCGRLRELVSLLPAGLWALHDALLAPSARISIASTNVPSPWNTTIAAHLPQSFLLLAAVLAHQGVAAICFAAAPLVALAAYRGMRRIAAAGSIALVLYVFTPFSFAGSVPQLAGGASLRFMLPVLAAGVLAMAPLARRFPVGVALLAGVSAAAGIVHVAAIFANDSLTTPALFAALAAAAALVFRHRVSRIAGAALIVALVLWGAWSAAWRAPAFYAGEMPRISRHSTHFFAWFRRNPHDARVTDIRAGELLVLAPSVRVSDTSGVSCRNGGSHAWIVVGTDPDVAPGIETERLAHARRCGRVLYADRDVVVVQPH